MSFDNQCVLGVAGYIIAPHPEKRKTHTGAIMQKMFKENNDFHNSYRLIVIKCFRTYTFYLSLEQTWLCT